MLRGITTDGSPLYPAPIAEVFGGVPHQLCTFHVIEELTKAVLGAVAKVRKELAAKPKLPRGRPTKAARQRPGTKKRLEQKIGDLFEHRYLFVPRHLSPADGGRCCGSAAACRSCGCCGRSWIRSTASSTAGAEPTRPWTSWRSLRRRVRRFRQVGKTLTKLFSPNLEKALIFLDDSWLPATSNAVERGNRRHRKMQKTIYRVRTEAHIRGRLALDLLRESQADGRVETTTSLHHARAA